MTIEKANAIIEQLKKLRDTINDKDASVAKDLYPTMHYTGEAINAGTRINWNGKVMKAMATLWDVEDNDPDHLPEFWGEIKYKDGVRIIPQYIEAIDPFHADELGWWNDILYRSKVDNNVYNPEQYPPNWEMIVDEQ